MPTSLLTSFRMYRPFGPNPAMAFLVAALVLLPVACSDSTAPDPDPDPGPGGGGGGGGTGPVASVVIEPGAVLLTAAGETMQLEAKAYDATGAAVQTDVTWQSTRPGTVSVSGAGLATAAAALGSAQITAVAEGVTSEPALALVARPAAGVVLIPDARIVTDPVAVDPAADYGPGWRYRIRVTGDAPEAGQLVIGTGGRSLAGRVVGATAQGAETELTVEFVALSQLFADLSIDETIPLVEMETGSGGSSWRAPEPEWGPAGFEAQGEGLAGQADTEFTLGRFKCTASAEVPDLDLPSPTLDIDPDLSLALGYANGLERYAVVGKITADFGYKPVFKAAFEGKVGCETVLKTVTVPLGGVLAWFVGIQVPLGVGFGLDGKLEIAEVGFDVSAHAEATAELGLLCPAAGGSCSGLTSFDTQRDFDFELIAPDPTEQFKLELSGKGFVFARPSIGSAFSASTQFAFLEATAGLEQSVDLATKTRQVTETNYASGFKLEGQIDVGPGKDLISAIDKLGKWLGTDLDTDDLAFVDVDETLAESPKGTFTITPATVEPGDGMTLGDMATFTIDLDPVTYLGIESVDRVEIFWKKDDGSGGFTLEPGRPGCTDISGSSGQTKFECETDFLEEHEGQQTFYAFVHAKMFGIPVPIPLEIADDGKATINVVEGVAPPGTARLLHVDHSGDVLVRAFNTEIRVDRFDVGDANWTFQESVDTTRTTVSSETVSVSAAMHAQATTSVSGDVLSSISGSISGSTSRTATESHGSVILAVAGSNSEHYWEIEVVDGDVPFTLTGTISVTGSARTGSNACYRLWLELLDGFGGSSGDYGIHDAECPDEPPGSVQVSGVLPPGTHSLQVFGSISEQSCESCSGQSTISMEYSLTLGGGG